MNTKNGRYVSGWCGTADCSRCAGSYPNGSKADKVTTDCVCKCHITGQQLLVAK